MKAEFEELKVEVSVLPQDDFLTGISDGKAFVTLNKADFIVYLSKDVLTAEILEKSGYKLFNSSKTIEICDDKALTYLALTGKGIKMPKTVFAPLMYVENEDLAFLEIVKSNLSFPIVVKSV
ncbi:MAG: RimK family alpha-L-glutamate ligase, partial [Clostridia bacterium]|nr:RimK family alpha-L-glutamate ligase [Clostridia bacterium]